MEKKSDGRLDTLGILAIVFKIAPKILPALGKAAKSLFGVKAVGAAASVGLYSYLLTWQMGVALVTFILIHEYGHLTAMKRCGIKTKGVYLIPGFGGAAVAEGSFSSARNEAYIAIMGPVWGILYFVLPVIGLYLYTGDGLYAAIAAFATFINLLNLFPVNPLDGGRIVKSLLYSYKASVGFLAMIVMFIVALYFSMQAGYVLLALIAVIGLGEMVSDYGLAKKLEHASTTFFRVLLLGGGGYFLFESLLPDFAESHWTLKILGAILISIFVLMVVVDVSRAARRHEGGSLFMYPFYIVEDFLTGLKEISTIRVADLKRKENFPPMKSGEVKIYGLSFVFLIAVHIALVVALATIPGSELAEQLLK